MIPLYTREDGDCDEPSDGDAVRAAALVTLIAGFGLLEVILLAGTAFAVGARRQIRTLGLVAASGGDAPARQAHRARRGHRARPARRARRRRARDRGGGLLLHPVWERLDDAEITSYVFRPLDLAVAILVGTLAGVAAATAPAIGAARMKPVDALAGRFRVTRTRAAARPRSASAADPRASVAGLLGNQLLAGSFRTYEKALAKVEETGGTLPQVAERRPGGPDPARRDAARGRDRRARPVA